MSSAITINGRNKLEHALHEAPKKKHAFWDAQPVGVKSIPEQALCELRQEPFNLPDGFEWSTVDIYQEQQLDELYEFLAKNYIEYGDYCMLRLDYCPAFLKWVLAPPGYKRDLHLGVRSRKAGKLLGFVAAVPIRVQSDCKTTSMAAINFLCVHKKLRSKRMAPVLIKEISRRVTLAGIFAAVYTGAAELPSPAVSCQFYHRNLSPRKLVEIGFMGMSSRMTMARLIKLFKLPDQPTISLRLMEERDIPSAHSLLKDYLSKIKFAIDFTEQEFAYHFSPREGVISTYVAANDDDENNGTVTDFVSFYHLPSVILGHPRHSILRSAYSYYSVATSVPFRELMQNALILAKNEGADVFNVLNLMENGTILNELKFGQGTGKLHYYLYNIVSPVKDTRDMGIIMP